MRAPATKQKKALGVRRAPSQERSRSMVEDILVATSRVLVREGGSGLTTLRVAEVAGVSVGSLYQYFPNKEALLFALHQREWERTRARMEAFLAQSALPFAERVRGALRAFFESEREEAALRDALAGGEAVFKETDTFRTLQRRSRRRFAAFLRRALPNETAADVRRTVEVIFLLTTSLAGILSDEDAPRGGDALAEIYVEMVVSYLETRRAEREGPVRSSGFL